MRSDKTDHGWRRSWPAWLALLALMGVALALRWRYVQEVSLSVDEFNTIWAAMNVPLRGLPGFPSGNIYPHGFIFTYLVVPFVLGQFNETLVHIPGLIVSLAMLPAAYWVGRKLFDERVALVATSALAVDPDAVLWGGRVRMYGLLQLLTLLAVYFYYRGLAGDRPRLRYLAMVLVVAAIFTHAEAGLLIPALGLATLAAWPWRRLLRRDTILPFVVAAAGALAFFLMSKYGQPGHLEAFESENRFYIGLPGDPLSGPRIFAPVFFSLYRLPFTLLALAGLYFVFRPPWRPPWDRRSPLTFLYVVLFSLLVPLVLLANSTWQNERYLFLLLPLLYLLAGEALCRLLDLPQRVGDSPVGLPNSPACGLPSLLGAFYPRAGSEKPEQVRDSPRGLPNLLGAVYPRAGSEKPEQVRDSPRGLPSLLGAVKDRFPSAVPWQPLLLAILIPLYIGLTGTHLAYRQELGYDLAFRYLQGQVVPAAGDRVVTVSPSACAVYLGQCDEFAIQHGYEEFVVSRPGDAAPVDLWTATPVLTRTAEFVDLLHAAPRVWFVSDTWRFQTRYDADFVQTVLDHLDLVYQERSVLIFRADGYQVRPQPTINRERHADFGQALALTGFGLSAANPAPGDEAEVTLNWQALEKPGVAYTAFLHLLAADGRGVAGVDEPVLRGLYQPDFWPRDATFADRHTLTLPPGLPPGRYRLDLGLYPGGQPGALLPVAGSDHLPLAMLSVGTVPEPALPTTQLDATFGGQIRLLGYDLTSSFQLPTSNLQLHWQALAPMTRDYTVFVHVVDANGEILTQDDRPPGDPFFPTSTWLPGTTVLDGHTLTLPQGAPPGEYTILVGVYHRPSDERLPAVDAQSNPLGDALPLATFTLGSESP
jgi:hypothetical protein